MVKIRVLNGTVMIDPKKDGKGEVFSRGSLLEVADDHPSLGALITAKDIEVIDTPDETPAKRKRGR